MFEEGRIHTLPANDGDMMVRYILIRNTVL